MLKTIINAPWFRSGLIGLVGVALLFKSAPLYAGIAFGIAFRELLIQFSSK
jgi:hypothetical protein